MLHSLSSSASRDSRRSLTWRHGAVRPIDGRRRRTKEYESKRVHLSDALRLALDLVEERIISEGEHPFRRTLADGTVVDLSSYDESVIIVTFQPAADGNHLFIDFNVTEAG